MIRNGRWAFLCVVLLAFASPVEAIDLKSWAEDSLNAVKKGIDKAIEDLGEPTGAPTPDAGSQSPTTAPGSTPSASTISQRDRVAEAQERLNHLGYDAGPVDGAYGARTAKAIKAYQRDQGLFADGKVTPVLLQSLRATTSSPAASQHVGVNPTQPVTIAPFPSAGGASETERVAEAQSILNQFGYDAGPVDGQYGGRTARAVEAFQRDQGLPVDGRITPELVAAIRAEAGLAPLNPSTTMASPTPATVPTATPAAERFDELTYANLLRLYVAKHHDLLDNDAFAWRHFQVFEAPAKGSAACTQLQQQVRNQITFADLVQRERSQLRSVLASFAAGPRIGEFTVEGYLTLEDYDLDAAEFPVQYIGLSGSRLQHDPDCASAASAGATNVPDGFNLRFSGVERVRTLPMGKEQARALLDGTFGTLRLPTRAEIRIGPLPFVTTPNREETGATVLSLAVLDPDGERVIHQFPPELFAPGATSETQVVAAQLGPAAEPLTPLRLALFMLRDNPDLVSAGTATELARRQIVAEQQFWSTVEQRLVSATDPKSPSPGMNLAQPLFAYEWQSLAARQPELAEELLEVFTRRDADWAFYRREPAYDPRLEAYVEASIFSRDAIAGRDAVFLAPDLAPVLMEHLRRAAAAVDTRVRLDFPLAAKYDLASGRLHFGQSYTVKGGGEPVRPLDAVARPKFVDGDGAEVASLISSPLPRSAEDTRLYAVPHGMSEPPQRKPGMRVSSNPPPTHWREMLKVNTNGGLNLGAISALALDREIEFAPVPLAADVVEAAQRGHADPRGLFQVTGRVTLEVDRAEVVTIRKDDRERRGGALFARVAAIEVIGPDGRLLARIDPESLATPAGLAAAQQQSEEAAQLAVIENVGQYAGTAPPLSAEVADLLMVRFLPETLDAEAERMLLARWHYEASFRHDQEEPQWGRFFVEGRAKPGPEERAQLLPRFKQWTAERARTMAPVVTLHFRHALVREPGPVPLGDARAPNTAARSCRSSAVAQGRSDPTLRQALENACAFLEQAASLPPTAIYADGGRILHSRKPVIGPRFACGNFSGGRDRYCAGIDKVLKEELLGREPELNDVVIIDREIVVPDDRPDVIARGGRSMDLVVELEITGIRRSDRHPPQPWTGALAQYQRFREELGVPSQTRFQTQPEAPVGLFLFDTHVRAARLIDEKSGETVLDLVLREPRSTDSSLLRQVEPEVVAAPEAPFGPDVVGLRLGMTFEAAEAVIREHMDVANVMVADRAWQQTAATGAIAPFTSGRMFETGDGSETIVLFDEPPSAPGTVVGLIRQVRFPKGAVAPAQIYARLKGKYGEPARSTDYDLAWHEPVDAGSQADRSCFPSYNAAADPRIWRDPDGSATDPQAMMARHQRRSPGLDGGHDGSRTEGCGPALSATFDTRQDREADRLVLRLVDLNRYGALYRQSKRWIEGGSAELGSAEAEVDLKL